MMKKKELTYNLTVTGWKVYPIMLFTIIGTIDFTVTVALGTYKLIKFIIE